MQLTKQNMNVFAAKYYDNPFCLTEDEFKSDVFKSSIIKRMLTAYSLDKTTNLKILVNMTISFFNVFEHRAATVMLRAKLSEDQYPMMNSILEYLSLPTIEGYISDLDFLTEIGETYK